MSKIRVFFLSSTPLTRMSTGYHVVKGGESQINKQLSQIYDVESFEWTKRIESMYSLKLVYLLDSFQILTSLLRSLLTGRFKVIVMTGMPVLESIPTFIIAKLLRVPIIIRETHWYWPKTLPSMFTWPINKIIVSNSNLVVCPGKKAYEYWHSLSIPNNKLLIVPFYASTLKIDQKIEEAAIDFHTTYRNNVVILYFGRLIEKKGIDYLIKAFAKLHERFDNIVLMIIGEGPERHNLEKLCIQMKLTDVVFRGAVEEKLKAAYFLGADIYVYPSITLGLPEEWPLGVVEAMSVGKPVIVSTAVGSAPDVVKQGVNGFVVQEKNVNALYNAIKIMIENPALRIRMGLASKYIIEEGFTYYHAVKGLDTAIKTVARYPEKKSLPPKTTPRLE